MTVKAFFAVWFLIFLSIIVREAWYFWSAPVVKVVPGKSVWRVNIEANMGKNINGLPGKLLTSIVFGGAELPNSFKAQLARVGLSHVVAASGMNVTLLAGGVYSLLRAFRFNRRLSVLLGIVLIVIYSSITGFEAPIVRAAIMASTLFLAPIVGRKSSGWAALLAAATIMLWVEPYLILNFGFLLSFTSMIGQMALIRLTAGVTDWWKVIIGIFGQTGAAILTTLPIVLIGFGKFSLVSIGTNALVLWTVEPLMILGIIITILGLVSTELARLASLPARPLLEYFLWVVQTFDRPEMVARISMNWLTAVGYYCLLAAAYLTLLRKQRGRLASS